MGRVERIMFEQGVGYSEAMYLADENPPRGHDEEGHDEGHDEGEEVEDYIPFTEEEAKRGISWDGVCMRWIRGIWFKYA